MPDMMVFDSLSDKKIRLKRRKYLFALLIQVNPESGIFLLETIERSGKVGCFDTGRFDSE
jgi:hypothetical protein